MGRERPTEMVCVARLHTPAQKAPEKLAKKRSAFISRLKSSGVSKADADAAVVIETSGPHKVVVALITAGPQDEYRHELRVSRPAYLRLAQHGVPLEVISG